MILTKKLSDKFAKSLAETGQIDKEFEESYSYCIDFVLDLVVYNLSLLIIGAILHNFVTALVYIISIVPLKMVAGGAHANTRGMCSVISYASFGLTILLSCILKPSPVFCLVSFFISIPFIILLSPVEHENKRFDDAGKKKLKRLSLIFSLPITVLFLVLFKFSLYKYCFTISICVITIFINQLIGLIIFKAKFKEN